jgi:hypothetical protein
LFNTSQVKPIARRGVSEAVSAAIGWPRNGSHSAPGSSEVGATRIVEMSSSTDQRSRRKASLMQFIMLE